MRQQPHVPVAALVGLHRRLAVDHRRDDLAVLGVRLLADDHPVAVADGGLHHRVTGHLQHEQVALAHEFAGEGEHVLQRLLGQDRTTGGDPADQGHVRGCRHRGLVAAAGQLCRGGVDGVAGQPDVEGARPVGVAAQPPLLLQHRELVGHRRGGGQPHRFTDLADRRGIAAALDGVADDLQHAALPLGQAVAVRAAVREGSDGGRLRARGARRTPRRSRTSRSSPPRRLLLGCSRSAADPSGETVAPRAVPIKHMFEVIPCPVAFVAPVR